MFKAIAASCRLCARHARPSLPLHSTSARQSMSNMPSTSRTSQLPTWPTPGQTQLRKLSVVAEPPIEPPDEPMGDEAVMILTEQAMAQIARAQDKAKNKELALRVMVESGGCHGYQYKMEVTDKREPDDYLFAPPDSTARLLIDSSSLALLSGSTIDYATELIGSSFRIKGNPHASDKGGCGCGVSWELKE